MLHFEKYIDNVSIDCVVFGYEAKKLKVLISTVAFAKNTSALIGGFIRVDEDIDDAAKRILSDRTSLDLIYLEQFKVFGKKSRYDKSFVKNLEKNIIPNLNKNKVVINTEWLNKRFISLGYYALLDIAKASLKKSELDEKIEWIDIDQVPKLIYDHNEMIVEALAVLRDNLDKKLIGFNLLPPTFTMKELQELYEAVYGIPFARNNFQKKMLALNVLERLEKKFTGAANKAPYLYSFKK